MNWFHRARLIVELAVLFIAAPLAVNWLVHGAKVPLFQVLVPVFVLFVVLLTLDREFSWAATLRRGFSFRHGLQIVLTFAVLGSAIVWYAYRYEHGAFLALPRRAPGLYALILIFYPLVSVVTQELVYRVFFFHRYRSALGGAPVITILMSAALFAFSHILFPGWLPMALSFAGGLLFAWRYHQTGSVWAVVFEHSLYGNLIFTAGLGRYFFTGISNVG